MRLVKNPYTLSNIEVDGSLFNRIVERGEYFYNKKANNFYPNVSYLNPITKRFFKPTSPIFNKLLNNTDYILVYDTFILSPARQREQDIRVNENYRRRQIEKVRLREISSIENKKIREGIKRIKNDALKNQFTFKERYTICRFS